MSLCLRLHSKLKIGVTFIKAQKTRLQENSRATDCIGRLYGFEFTSTSNSE